ncbi:MAG: ribonuclease protein component [Bacteroidota bacterium]
MENIQRYTLGKNEKLKSRKAIEQLFKEGKSFSLFPFRIIYTFKNAELQNSNNQLQTAFSVSKRYFKKATDRNRIKRLMREGWRLQKNILTEKINEAGKMMTVFIVYTGNELPVYDFIFEKKAAVIKRLIKICDEAIVTNM